MNPQHIASDLIRVKDVQWPVSVVGEEIRHIDQKRDRAQPDGAQLVLQPFGRRAILDAPNNTPVKYRALAQCIRVNRNCDRAGKLPFNCWDIPLLERAQPPRRQIAGNTTHSERIRAVGRDPYLYYRINLGRVVLGQPIGKTVSDIAGRQFDDAIMFFG